MKPINRKADRILGAPEGWDEKTQGPCDGLPIRIVDGHGLISYWKASWKERILILFGRPVRFTLYGYSHPPIALDTEKD